MGWAMDPAFGLPGPVISGASLSLRRRLGEHGVCGGLFHEQCVCGAGGAVHIRVWDSPAHMKQSPLFSRNLKVTLLEAPNVELTLN